MSEIIDYSPIGIKNPSGTLIAFGAQTVKFTGSVTVNYLSGETVINIGGGSSVGVQKDGGTVFNASQFNFIGSNITVNDNGGVAEISVTGAPIDIEKNGSNVLSSSTLNFKGSLVNVTNNSGVADIDILPTQSSIRKNGSQIIATDKINFLGSNITVTNNSGVADISVTSAPIDVQKNGSTIVTSTILNFEGSNINVINDSGSAKITVSNAPITGQNYAVATFDNTGNLTSDNYFLYNKSVRTLEICESIADPNLGIYQSSLLIGRNNNMISGSGFLESIICGSSNQFNLYSVNPNVFISGSSNYHIEFSGKQSSNYDLKIIGSSNSFNHVTVHSASLNIFGAANTLTYSQSTKNVYIFGNHNSLEASSNYNESIGNVFILGELNSFTCDGTNHNVTYTHDNVFAIGRNNSLELAGYTGACFSDSVIIGFFNNISAGNNIKVMSFGRYNQISAFSNEFQMLIGHYASGSFPIQTASVIINGIANKGSTTRNSIEILKSNNTVSINGLNLDNVSKNVLTNFTLDCDDLSLMSLTSSSVVTSDTLAINNATEEGHIVTIFNDGNFDITLKDSVTVWLPSRTDLSLTTGSSITLLWTGTKWITLSYNIY